MGRPMNSRGKEISVDPKCWDLANAFLSEYGVADAFIADLAEEIQRCCEDASTEAEKRRSNPIAVLTKLPLDCCFSTGCINGPNGCDWTCGN